MIKQAIDWLRARTVGLMAALAVVLAGLARIQRKRAERWSRRARDAERTIEQRKVIDRELQKTNAAQARRRKEEAARLAAGRRDHLDGDW